MFFSCAIMSEGEREEDRITGKAPALKDFAFQAVLWSTPALQF